MKHEFGEGDVGKQTPLHGDAGRTNRRGCRIFKCTSSQGLCFGVVQLVSPAALSLYLRLSVILKQGPQPLRASHPQLHPQAWYCYWLRHPL